MGPAAHRVWVGDSLVHANESISKKSLIQQIITEGKVMGRGRLYQNILLHFTKKFL